MSTRTDYTDAEWELLTDMPRLAAFGAMAAEEGGPVSSTRELWTSMVEVGQAARMRYPNNTLIQEVMRSFSEPADDDEVSIMGWKPDGGEPLGNAIVAQALETASRVREVLASQATPEEAAEYTAWVLGIARAGCGAVRSGLFGLVGAEMTAAEEQYMEDLASALRAE
jgi:hypothetical protein